MLTRRYARNLYASGKFWKTRNGGEHPQLQFARCCAVDALSDSIHFILYA